MIFVFSCGGSAGHINPALAVAGRLRELLPDFEDTLHRLGAFTFYRLSVDGDTPDAARVGAVFAALCGCAEDTATEQEGARLYRGYHERLAETVAMVDFQKV